MKPAPKRSVVVLAICAGCTALFLYLWWSEFPPLRKMEWFAQDWLAREGRKTPVDDRLVLIGIDKPVYLSDFSDEELQREPVLRDLQKSFPWSRAVWARLIEKLADAGAKVIVIDVVFATTGDGDDELKLALEKYKDRVVIGYNISEGETERGDVRELQLPSQSVFVPRATNSAVEDDRLGYVNLWPDPDGTFREAIYRATSAQMGHVVSENIVLESLDARALEKFGRGDLIPAGFDSKIFRYTAGPGEGYRPIPLGYVLSPKLWEINYKNGKVFKDKIILIGPTAGIFHDEHDTPFETPKRMLGPEIHLNIINAALHQEFLAPSPVLINILAIIFAGAFAMVFCFQITQPIKRFLAVLCVLLIYWTVAFFIFSRAHATLNILLTLVPSLALVSSSVIVLTYDFFLERLEKRRVRKTLERYVSRDVVKELLDNPQTYFNARGGVRRNVTILFSDVRGFTTLTESADSGALVKQLNEYFEEMVGLVFEHNGSLDKFIGDAVMAVWGNIVSHGESKDACNAVATALAMKQSLKKLNVGWKSRGMLELAFGIGINHGEVIVGELGSSQKVEFTAIGDPVNLASRLEGLTKEYHLDLLLGENMAALVRDTFLLRTVDFVQVKGKTKPVDVFAVIGEKISTPTWLARYEDGVRLYRERKFSEAAGEFQESLSEQPEDYLTSMYLKRCQALIENPPGESWDGVFVMTKK
jgi:adenylate cyclase